MPKDYLDQLAEFVATLRLQDLASSTVGAAKNVVLDTIGAINAGSRQPENANFARLASEMGGPGKSTLIGHLGTTQPLWATMVNATAGVALEMDEGSRLGGGHPSIHVTPAALAVGEDLGRSGAEVLESIIVGYEVTSRVGTATQARAEVHSHGTWGTIGAAAATSRLLKFRPGPDPTRAEPGRLNEPGQHLDSLFGRGHYPQLVPRQVRVSGNYGRAPGPVRFHRGCRWASRFIWQHFGERIRSRPRRGRTGDTGPIANRAELFQVPRLLLIQPPGAGRSAILDA